MLSYYQLFVSTSANALAHVLGGSSQTGILVTLGLLLLVLGTVLRRSLPAADETTSSRSSTPWAEPIPLNTYIGTVDSVANTAASRRHANAV